MELTIAIWEDCKRLLTDNQPITCRRLQPFADIKVHVEGFPASAWPNAKEVSVVCHLYTPFLAGYVNTDRQALSVRIPCLERCIFTVLQMLLEH